MQIWRVRYRPAVAVSYATWFLIGLAAAGVAYGVGWGAEQLVVPAAETGLLPGTLGFGLVAALLVGLTVVALRLVGERATRALVASAVGTLIAYLIGSAPLAALNIGLAVGLLGERAHRRAPAPLAPADARAPRAKRRRRRAH